MYFVKHTEGFITILKTGSLSIWETMLLKEMTRLNTSSKYYATNRSYNVSEQCAGESSVQISQLSEDRTR